MGLQFLFMDDNAPCHRTVAAEQLLESEDIERMDWSARSPDLNPIEHVWDFLGRRLAARTLPPVTIRELRSALQDEWAAMPQQRIDTLILSMGRRCETCLAVGRSYPLLKTGCFLLDTHHRDVSAFSRIALHATFSIKLLFIPLISILASEKQVGRIDVSPPPRSERYGIARCWQQWITEGRVYRRGGSGRPRNTNDREDRAIRRVATSAPTTSLASIQRHLPPSRHPVPSRETIRRRLTEVGLRSRRPLRRLPLTPHHRQCRLDFCRPRATWSVTDWRRVIFSDESRFSLSADDHRTRVWRRTGQRSDPAFIVERHTAISQGVTVWGAISWDTRSSLVVLQGTLTARRYVDDILTPIVLPMLSSRPGAIYQQDNARPHTARLSQQCLQGYDVLPWPARSPDLSPIEHV
ncbi:transposable element Tcb2 transposase [Trichonephila clavipes]|nr:transposable element Tcb2 transposase [Trichonephila clavipes]